MNVIRNLIIATVVAVLLVALLLIVFIRENDRMVDETATQLGNSVSRGGRLFDQYCSGCHGRRGEGLAGVYPPLNVEDLWAGRDDVSFYGTLHDYISLTIAGGHPAQRMPSWADDYGGPLRDDQIEDLTRFVLNWQGEQPEGVRDPGAAPGVTTTPAPEVTPAGTEVPVAEGDPAAGEPVFVQNCSSCHGEQAEGGALGPSLVSEGLRGQPDEFFRDVITHGRPGTAMPAWGPILSAQDIENVIAWLRVKQEEAQ
jgi:mono/diheme cytochrome c family protein